MTYCPYCGNKIDSTSGNCACGWMPQTSEVMAMTLANVPERGEGMRRNDPKPNGGHEWIHSETIDPHRHTYDEEWVCECGDLQMRIEHAIPCDDDEWWSAEINNYHVAFANGSDEFPAMCGVHVANFDAAKTWCEATLPLAKIILSDAIEAKYTTPDDLSYDRGFHMGMEFQKRRMRIRGFLWNAWYSFWFGFEGICQALMWRIRGNGGE